MSNKLPRKSSRYRSAEQYQHNQADKIGVLITNLGTPKAPTAKALRPYLKQFLSDPRVVEIPRILWWCILNGIILNTRPAKSAHAYSNVWTEEGSPLALYTKAQADNLRELQSPQIIVDWAMRYGEPSVGSVIQKLQDQGVRKLLVLPLYPQYSASTTGSTFDALAEDFTKRRWIPELRFITSYHDHPLYIRAIANSIRKHWEEVGRSEKLIFSYHGVPLRYLHSGDPYHCQCLKTTRLIAEELELEPEQFMTCFQSRFGREEWLRPYTDETLKALPSKGVKSVSVICPGFSSDCLETIEEINMENREYFEEAGGESYHYIPALNDSSEHIQFLNQLIQQHLQGWYVDNSALEKRLERANATEHNQPS